MFDAAETLTGMISAHVSARQTGLVMIVQYMSEDVMIHVTRSSAVQDLILRTAMPAVITPSEMIRAHVNVSISGPVNTATSILVFARISAMDAMDLVCTSVTHVYRIPVGIHMDVVYVMQIGEVMTVVNIWEDVLQHVVPAMAPLPTIVTIV